MSALRALWFIRIRSIENQNSNYSKLRDSCSKCIIEHGTIFKKIHFFTHKLRERHLDKKPPFSVLILWFLVWFFFLKLWSMENLHFYDFNIVQFWLVISFLIHLCLIAGNLFLNMWNWLNDFLLSEHSDGVTLWHDFLDRVDVSMISMSYLCHWYSCILFILRKTCE